MISMMLQGGQKIFIIATTNFNNPDLTDEDSGSDDDRNHDHMTTGHLMVASQEENDQNFRSAYKI